MELRPKFIQVAENRVRAICSFCGAENPSICRPHKLIDCDYYVCHPCQKSHNYEVARDDDEIMEMVWNAAPGGWMGYNVRKATPDERASMERAKAIRDAGIAQMILGQLHEREEAERLPIDPIEWFRLEDVESEVRVAESMEQHTMGYGGDYYRESKRDLDKCERQLEYARALKGHWYVCIMYEELVWIERAETKPKDADGGPFETCEEAEAYETQFWEKCDEEQ